MNQLEDRIVALLRDRATGEVDVTDLLDTARVRGRAYRRRRRALQVGGGCAVALVAVLGTALALPRPGGHAPVGPPVVGGPPRTSPFPTPSAAPALGEPAATAGTPATADPSVVGADPALLHVYLPSAAMPVPASQLDWSSLDGLERIIVNTGAGTVDVQVTRDRTALDPLDGTTHPVAVGGKNGTGTGSQVRWEPVPGVWAQVVAQGSATDVIRLAGALRFDRVLRCAVPFRFTALPPGTTVEGCDMAFTAGGATGRATVHSGRWAVTVDVFPGVPFGPPTTTIGGHPARVKEYPGDGGATILQIDIDYGDHVVDLLAEGRYDRAAVLAMAAGYHDLLGTPPATWPAPLG